MLLISILLLGGCDSLRRIGCLTNCPTATGINSRRKSTPNDGVPAYLAESDALRRQIAFIEPAKIRPLVANKTERVPCNEGIFVEFDQLKNSLVKTDTIPLRTYPNKSVTCKNSPDVRSLHWLFGNVATVEPLFHPGYQQPGCFRRVEIEPNREIRRPVCQR